MQLFQNRAGLKKAYADLKDEFHLLRDRLKQQEGATIRVQEQLDGLGDLLADLRSGLRRAGVLSAARPVEDLPPAARRSFGDRSDAPAGDPRERPGHKRSARPPRTPGSPMSTRRLQAAPAEADSKRERLAAAQAELQRLTAFWHYFRRRRLQKSLEVAAPGRGARRRGGRRPARRAQRHQQRSAAEFPGISLGARRNINLAIIGYAELLCEHVDAFGLAARAKEAVARRVHEMNFGAAPTARATCSECKRRRPPSPTRSRSRPASERKLRAPARHVPNTAIRPTRCRPRTRCGRLRPRRPASQLERARRRLLGSLHAAAALSGRRPRSMSVGAPRLRRPSLCAAATARSAAICGRLVEEDSGGGIVLDILERLQRRHAVGRAQACSRARGAGHPGACAPPRASSGSSDSVF